jgi:zinc protease
MKRILIALMIALALPLLGQNAPKREYDTTQVSPMGKEIAAMAFPNLVWHVPEVGKEITRETLPNGLVLYLYPDHSVPVVHLQMVLKGGALYETPEEDHLSSLTASFIQMGGSKARSYEEITAELEGLAADLYGWSGDESYSFGAHCLKEHFPRVGEVLRERVLEPGFREDKLGLIKQQEAENILRQKDYPGWVIETLFGSKLFGDHPYGRIVRVPRIEAITTEAIQKEYRRIVVPDRAFLAISGDIDPKETLALVMRLFGEWKKSGEALPPVQKVNESITPGFYHFEKDIPQANIRVGHLGVKRGNPDEIPLMVMNMILGGEAFKSRIMSRVRSDEGLAYSAGSFFGSGTLEPSPFACFAETKNEKAYRTVQIMKETMLEMTQKPPSDEEMKQAKETVINSFIHRWSSSSGALSQIMGLEIQGRPKDYYQTYLSKVQAVTAADVQRVAAKYIHPDKVVGVIVSKRAEMKDWPQDLPMAEVTLPPEYMK